jgi:GNAT superfamily N-acetyltransferase
VRRIYKPTRKEVAAVIQIYRECFLPEQRIAESSLVGTIDEFPDSRRNAFFVAEENGEIAGFTFVLFFPSFRMAHLMYIGVDLPHARHGLGMRLFDAVIEACLAFDHPPHWVTVETLRPELARDEQDRVYRERSIRFLERLGCRKVAADFQAPPLGPELPVVPYWIMARPVADPGIDPELVPEMLHVIYKFVYGIPDDHPLVVHCMKSLEA